MIGLLFFGTIGLWWLVALFLGIKLPKWFKLKSGWSFLFVPLVFLLPVWDEVIAWPQIQMFCHNMNGYQFRNGMNEMLASGRTVHYREAVVPLNIFPPTIAVTQWQYQYVDSRTGEVIFFMPAIAVEHGWLHIPNGSSGNYMTAFLKGCSKGLAKEEASIREVFRNLEITETSSR